MMELEVVSQVASDLAANEAAHLHDLVRPGPADGDEAAPAAPETDAATDE